MNVQIWSDYVCPFCYIGKRKFEKALENFDHKDQVQIVYKSFELDPNAPLHADQDMIETLAGKYGTSLEQAREMTRGVTQQAKEVGLAYDFDKMKRTNTRDAHRLTHWAASQGKMEEITERLLQAYFIESKHIGEHETLERIAEEAGLNKEEAREILSSDAFTADVEKDIRKASQIGVTGVPFFVFEEKWAVSGAQPVEAFEEVLNKVWEEQQGSGLIHMTSKEGSGDQACKDDSCGI
ncbi:DsbA family oxidoreductase [Jeotgalibacillus campisalis]|uniref:DSBA oxidoreductase n=1 Tax=Jeotgalibacillus campisalis TaxID=220754 RepID=A0A0C2R085_9BACL|nr:DsbA family oxidoreductase [Jeotgalibacillus campisalis]KIL43735.1 DSBA oxidoreductase [Jeotgalibacillus campisalis]